MRAILLPATVAVLLVGVVLAYSGRIQGFGSIGFPGVYGFTNVLPLSWSILGTPGTLMPGSSSYQFAVTGSSAASVSVTAVGGYWYMNRFCPPNEKLANGSYIDYAPENFTLPFKVRNAGTLVSNDLIVLLQTSTAGYTGLSYYFHGAAISSGCPSPWSSCIRGDFTALLSAAVSLPPNTEYRFVGGPACFSYPTTINAVISGMMTTLTAA